MKKLYICILITILTIAMIISCDKNSFSPIDTTWKDASEKIQYYKHENLNRYKNYLKKNPNLDINKIIIEVNIGLDNTFYTNTKKATNINSNIVLVNKYNYLDKDYTPNNLVLVRGNNTKMVDYAAEAFNDMVDNAKNEGYTIIGVSGYRSYNYQNNLYNKYAKSDGIEKADTYSARAGYSEHQTGLAIDVSNAKTSYTNFENTEEYKWMQDNAHKYGFIMRYQKDKEYITGYIYESWHYRYVGKEIAEYIKKHNISYEEYYVMFLDV